MLPVNMMVLTDVQLLKSVTAMWIDSFFSGDKAQMEHEFPGYGEKS